MSEKTSEIEIITNDSVLEIDSKPKNFKHNSKRRRCKKNQHNNKLSEDLNLRSNSDRVDEVVNYLCNTISKNESDASTAISFSTKAIMKSTKSIGTVFKRNHKKIFGIDNYLPATSTTELTGLFENLQVNSSHNLKSNNFSEFLNSASLIMNNCDSFSKENILNQNKNESKKTCKKKQKKAINLNEKLKEKLNCNSAEQFLENSVIQPIDSSPVRSDSEFKKDVNSSTSKAEINCETGDVITKHFNNNIIVKPCDKSTTSKKNPKLKLSREEYEQVLLRVTSGKCKKLSFKKSSNKKESVKEKNEFVADQKIFPSLKTHQKKTSNEATEVSKSLKNKKKKQSIKNSAKSDKKYPDYLISGNHQSTVNHSVLSGIIRINQKNFNKAYITAPDQGSDILIEGLKDRNRALEGDEVYYVLKPKEFHRQLPGSPDVQRTAFVIGIKTLNHNRCAIGVLNNVKNKNVNYTIFSPRDWRLPKIKIKKNNWPAGFLENYNNFKTRLYFAKILKWDDLRFANGVIIKEVGLMGNVETETAALLLNYGLDTKPFSEDLKKFLPPPTFRISEKEIKKREDFRKECIFTIDPVTALDLDDAVSCKKLSNGNYEVGVHISDVSYFLTEGTPLDKNVAQRATTIYLVQKTYPMLPIELCKLGSLTPGEDKLSFSVIWEISSDCRILSHRFCRSIINSCAQFSYEQVQSIITNSISTETLFPKIYGNYTVENLRESLSFLYNIAMNLRSKRFMNGALRINKKKIYFLLDESQMPVDYAVEVHKESQQLIEEFMLLANITVAERLHNSFPKIAFLRSHSPPLILMLEKIRQNLEKYGIILNISTSKNLHKSLMKYSGDNSESEARMLVLSNIIAKPMARAKYYCSSLYPNEEDRRHYALNVPLYTHFTSPLRRYADVMTHRLLAASMGYCDHPNWTIEYVESIANNCNKQKYAAKLAGEMSNELFLSVYIGFKGPIICEAVVCDIKDKSLDCIVLSTGAHQRLYFERIKGELIREKEDGIIRLIIKWPADKNHESETVQIIEMFSIVKIELKQIKDLKIEGILLRKE